MEQTHSGGETGLERKLLPGSAKPNKETTRDPWAVGQGHQLAYQQAWDRHRAVT